MFEIDQSSEVYFYYTILSFCLAVDQEVESGEKFLFNTKKVV